MLARLGQWILQSILFKFFKYYLGIISAKIVEHYKKKQKEKADQEAKEKLDKVLKKPDATLEEKAEAYEEFVNRNS